IAGTFCHSVSGGRIGVTLLGRGSHYGDVSHELARRHAQRLFLPDRPSITLRLLKRKNRQRRVKNLRWVRQQSAYALRHTSLRAFPLRGRYGLKARDTVKTHSPNLPYGPIRKPASSESQNQPLLDSRAG